MPYEKSPNNTGFEFEYDALGNLLKSTPKKKPDKKTQPEVEHSPPTNLQLALLKELKLLPPTVVFNNEFDIELTRPKDQIFSSALDTVTNRLLSPTAVEENISALPPSLREPTRKAREEYMAQKTSS